MRKSVLSIAPAMLFLAIIVAMIPSSPEKPPTISEAVSDLDLQLTRPAAAPQPPEPPSSRKQGENPMARLDFELQRLADPSTGAIPPNIHRQEQDFAAKLPRWDSTRHPVFSAPSSDGGSLFKAVPGWTYRGPFNIGGRTRALGIDVSDPSYQTLLAGGISGGMWKTTDDGDSWTLTTGSSQLHSVSCLAQDTRSGDTGTWYYGTGEARGNSASTGGAPYRGDGIFKSVDGGDSWSLIPSTTTSVPDEFDQSFDYVWRVAVDPSESVSDEIYAATYGIIFRSINGGESWTEELGNPEDLSTFTDVSVSSAGVVYASLSSNGGDAGIHRSADGQSWTDITPTALSSWGRIVMALAPSDENILYALVADANGGADGFFKYTYVSGDGSGSGGIWEDRSAYLAGLPDYGSGWDFESYGGYCQTIAIKPDDPNTVFIGGIHLNRSTDGFTSSSNSDWVGGWQYDNQHADQHWMIYQPGSNNIAYTGSDGGVHKTLNASANNVSWISLNNGYNTSQFYTLAIDENLSGSDIIVGGMQDNGSWWTNEVSPTASWVEEFSGDGCFCAIADHSTSVGQYYFSYQYGGIYAQEVDSNGNWQTWTRVDPTGGGDYLFVNPFILDPNDHDMMYVASSNGVWRNSDLSAIPLWNNDTTAINWTQLTTQPAAEHITALAMPSDGTRTLYFGTIAGHLYKVDNAHTAPGGSTPTDLHTGAGFPSGAYVSSIAIDPTDSQRLMIAFSNYSVESLFFSEDGGSTWQAVSGNLEDPHGPSCRSVAIVPFDGRYFYFVGTSTGLYSTLELDGASTVWQLEGSEIMGTVVVDMLKTRPVDGLVVAATHGKGVYSVEIPTGTATIPSARPASLAQNVPNPFNPSTEISFVTGQAGPVSLKVYDMKGRCIRTLIDEEIVEGSHSVSWNGRDSAGERVATGSYFYQLTAPGIHESRKMSLVK